MAIMLVINQICTVTEASRKDILLKIVVAIK